MAVGWGWTPLLTSASQPQESTAEQGPHTSVPKKFYDVKVAY